jgi:tRNA(Arg) A34 adenosine deaminase TadA
MWDAYTAGTIPVGAVIVDETGAVASEGRNRIFDDPEDRQLAGSRLAHAEINALVRLPSDGRYETWALLTTLEPCHLCLSAAISARIGALGYAAPDPYGGAVRKLLPSADHLDHPLVVEGPLEGPPGRLAELLFLAHFLWRMPDGHVVAFYRRTRPELMDAAAALPTPAAGASLADAFAALP